ncbi:MAG: DUF1957 domain-containing protein [Bacteroidetes bacterium]|nr:DUF1957 domain-containing protein [Bacteroidota bacterium]
MAKPKLGRFVLVLHSHLPFVVNHGKWPHGMEWLFEAASETYIPILNVLNELVRDGRKPRLTMSVTPVLAEQLASPQFVTEFDRFLDEEIERAVEDINLFTDSSEEKPFLPLAHFWKNFYEGIKKDFVERYNRDLVGAFRSLQENAVLDIMTCGATHGYFPLLSQDSSIRAQIKTAISTHQKHFKRKPRGIWLPECAYRPRYPWKPPIPSELGDQRYFRQGVEELLDENGLEYFIVDSSLVQGGKAVGIYMGRFESLRNLMQQFEKEAAFKALPDGPHSVYEVYNTKSSVESPAQPVAIFARDVETSMQVWSSEQGYPGGEWYLDFHKKHHQSGHRYWRVTSLDADLGLKVQYQPSRIAGALDADADHFVQSIKSALEKFKNAEGFEGTLTAPFDAELFGHWWFEGPEFLRRVFERLEDDGEIMITNCSGHLDEHPPEKIIAIPEGSWGAGGSHYVWMNHEVSWMWNFIYRDELEFQKHIRQWNGQSNEKWIWILKQMARELLLLQASDWQFLISTESAIDYAIKRFSEHQTAFDKLGALSQKLASATGLSPEDETWLQQLKETDFLFDDASIDLLWFSGNQTS